MLGDDPITIYALIAAAGLGLFVVAITGLVWSVRSGQLEDLETPALRVLFDDHSSMTSSSDRQESDHV
ncbi:MAG: cbb3-type cytochrome oxidase assembly protein CcoS [Planctomycetota bacterium]